MSIANICYIEASDSNDVKQISVPDHMLAIKTDSNGKYVEHKLLAWRVYLNTKKIIINGITYDIISMGSTSANDPYGLKHARQ